MPKVDKPTNPTFKARRAPTILATNTQFVPKKYFPNTFNVPSFTGTRNISIMNHRERPWLDNKGVPMKKKHRIKGHVNTKYKEKHSLLSKSFPCDFFDAFFPFREDKQVKEDGCLSFKEITQYTNQEAMIAGTASTTYLDFKSEVYLS